MNELKIAVAVIGVGSGGTAAVCWFMSATVKIPELTFQKPEKNPMYIALRKAGKLNAYAAFCACISAGCQVVQFILFP